MVHFKLLNMLHTFIKIVCFIVCTRATSVDERLNALESIIQVQSKSISFLKQENNELKSRVDHLENITPRSAKIIERENAYDNLMVHYKNNWPYTKTNETYRNAEIGYKGILNAKTINEPNVIIENEVLNRKLPKRLSENVEEVAFHVFLSGNKCYNDHEVIDYDGEELDLGNGYNQNDGIYVVPVAGVYVFVWTFLADKTQYVVTEIVLNGVSKGWAISDGTYDSILYSPSTRLVILNVNAGDHVFIRRVKGRGCSAVSNQYDRSSFSGWRLF